MSDFPFPVVHLYSSPCWHEEQIIGCNKEGRAALLKLLQTGESQECFVNDGEGFDLLLIEADAEMLPVPYTDGDMGARERPGERSANFWGKVVARLLPIRSGRRGQGAALESPQDTEAKPDGVA